jgi:hypothetical protein
VQSELCRRNARNQRRDAECQIADRGDDIGPGHDSCVDRDGSGFAPRDLGILALWGAAGLALAAWKFRWTPARDG